jgi:hypothetical protein
MVMVRKMVALPTLCIYLWPLDPFAVVLPMQWHVVVSNIRVKVLLLVSSMPAARNPVRPVRLVGSLNQFCSSPFPPVTVC